MNEQNEKQHVEKVNTPGVSVEQLLKLFMEQSKETAQSNKALADALLQSRIPYLDPKVLAEREQRRIDRLALVSQVQRDRAAAKKYHAHVNEGGKPNIKWMEHSNGLLLGVCGECFAQFDATHNVEDANLLRSDPKSIRNMGRAGIHARKGSNIAG